MTISELTGSDAAGISASEAEDWRFKHAWSWYQEHVKHRTAMLNFLLIAVGVMANAYVALLKEKNFELAGWLSAFAALIAYSFLCLDVITLRKIQLAKAVLRELVAPPPTGASAKAPTFAEIIDSTKSRAFARILDSRRRPTNRWARALRLDKDRTWTFIIEGAMTLIAALAAADAWSIANLGRAGVALVVAMLLVPVFAASVRDYRLDAAASLTQGFSSDPKPPVMPAEGPAA